MNKRRTRLNIVLILCQVITGNVTFTLAQTAIEEERELETDRDAFTPATSTAGRRRTILESSYSFIDNRNVAQTHSFPELLIRHGITERIELRLGWNYEVGGDTELVIDNEGKEELSENSIERESQILYGIKATLSEQQGFIPRSAAILQGYTPTSGPSNISDFVAAYAFGWELVNRWRLDSSIRYGTEHSREDAFNIWAPSMALRIPLNDRWHAHAEYFGAFTQGAKIDTERGFLSPGMHVLLTPNLELGARVGWVVTDASANFFSNVGIGWRF